MALTGYTDEATRRDGGEGGFENHTFIAVAGAARTRTVRSTIARRSRSSPWAGCSFADRRGDLSPVCLASAGPECLGRCTGCVCYAEEGAATSSSLVRRRGRARHLAADDALSRKVEVLTSVQGTGQATAPGLPTKMPELGGIDGQSASQLGGFGAGHARGGHLEGAGTSSAAAVEGHGECSYMATVCAARHNPDVARKYRDA